METNYRKIEFGFGDISSAIKKLNQYKERGELVYGEFNGQKLYSDIDDVNSAYKKITGKTKAEFDAERKAENVYEVLSTPKGFSYNEYSKSVRR